MSFTACGLGSAAVVKGAPEFGGTPGVVRAMPAFLVGGGPATLHTIAEFVPPPPDGTGKWIGILLYVAGTCFFVIGGIEKAKRLFGRQPPVEALIAGLASVEQLKVVEQRVEKLENGVKDLERLLITKVDSHFQKLNEARSVSVARLYEAVDGVKRELHESTQHMLEKIGEVRVEVHEQRGGRAR